MTLLELESPDTAGHDDETQTWEDLMATERGERQKRLREAGMPADVAANSYDAEELARRGVSMDGGFGFAAGQSMRLFCARPGGRGQPTTLCEVVLRECPKPAQETPKAEVSAAKWKTLAPALAAEFNGRLREERVKAGKWVSTRALAVREDFGKEAVLLAWAVEGLDDEDEDGLRTAVAAWSALAPEERWWLYLMANARHGDMADGRGKGWRAALGTALCWREATDGREALVAPRVEAEQALHAARGRPALRKKGD